MIIIYYLTYLVLWTAAWLPLRVLYLFSDFTYLTLYYFIGYRRKVVRQNIANSFPQMSENERKKIEKRFYRHFCDIFAETIHLMHISEKEMMSRMKFTNIELFKQYSEQGRNAIWMLGHYGNWEYMVCSSLYINNRDITLAGVYRKQKNKFINSFFLKLRTKFNTTEIEKNQLFREVYKYQKAGKHISFAMMADQTPSKRNLHYWSNFLNQDTPVLVGGERIARKLDFVLIYVDIKKIKRGYYEATLKLIDDHVGESAEYEDTEKYIRMMEDTILHDPAYWLWTHKRWKHKRELS
ncbi:MAG: lysophospholipid acyltransferase family protein [Bacteroidales bacterium]|nr:lysophospholipid acyltransferase family protein [Bacteroidales bacterium]